ncbi:threonine--tRNA ligase [Bythopirellula goksoeyrii]|uniref:Threonine--tRNA ligase n=1 Tax=Bythopirellula goksoeyrii TaxID=1400387 RepID=A0A5B9Q7Z4_9BACT|nr:threonine--tRNA ligase [Bythopirellula goksoeyrii]QEG33850.1 Threonine--tRNA ligase [Bythopirellula goksoeyrii]
MLSVTLPDGSEREYTSRVTPYDIAAEIGAGLAKAAIAAEVDGAQIDLHTALPTEGSINLRLLTKRDPESLDILRHSCAHVMAQAVMRLHDGVQLAFGPCTNNGFYYDFQLKEPLSDEDFPAIEAEMKRIVKENLRFERMEVPRAEALALCQELGQEFKVEHIETGLSGEESLSFYRQGEFLDLCRGRHIPSTSHIGKAFKLTSLAGAYWKGDAARPQLQRLYATAFFDKQELEDYLQQLEEAKRRDHRVLGKQLELFTISPLVGSGLILWLPKGAIIRQTLEDFLKSELRQRGYEAVYTPNIGKVDLYEISGHFPYYSDSQFAPIEMEDGERYLLKPMNCPHHIMIYKSKPRSYRDLPVRLAEFGTVYRYEQSGELSGMTRVRGFTQDDAHIFCTDDQVADEVRGCLEMTLKVLKSLGMDNYRVRLGFRDPDSDKYVGKSEVWDRAEAAIQQVAEEMDLPGREPEPGEAAFYGPKIDFVVTDCIGREWQLGTVQLDYNLPSTDRFGLEYIGADNQPHMPVMIHRAPLGSMERFVGVLIEHFAGAFPLWLAPEQARILTVSEKSEEYGHEIEQKFKEAGFRMTGDYRGQKLGAKIREAQLELIPYMLVVGEKDAENGTVTLRDRIEGDLGAMPTGEALSKLRKEVAEKTVRQVAKASGAALVDRSKKNEY